jgi:V/A-type H+-transporting ATPase subunit C
MRFRFQAVNAKIAAMRGALLTAADYDNLCRLDSVDGIGMRLRERREYASLLSGLEDTALRRGTLEERLPLSLYSDYERIRFYFYERDWEELLSALFLRFELDALKQLLCMIFDERDISYTQPEIELLFARHARLDTAKLTAAKTVKELIDELRHTPLYSALSGAYGRDPTLFSLERQLDLHYYMHLWKKINGFKDKETQTTLRRLVGTQIDLLNVLWVYRLKHYYKIPNEQIFAYVIPINYRVSADDLSRMAECAGEAELTEAVSRTPYRGVYTVPGRPPFVQPELRAAQAMRKLYKTEVRRHPDSLAVTAAYIFEKEQEINNITVTLEGVRYGLPAERIMGYLCL